MTISANHTVTLLRRITVFTDETRPTAAQIRAQGTGILSEPSKSSLAFFAVWRDSADVVMADAGEYAITPHRIGVLPDGTEVSVTGTSTTGLFARQDYNLEDVRAAPAITFQLTGMTVPSGAAALEIYVRTEA